MRTPAVATVVLLAGGLLAVPGLAGTAAKTELVSVSSAGAQGTDQSTRPSISASGRFVAFESNANNLVQGDTNGKQDVFVRDRKMDQTRRVSVSSAGIQGNRSSADPSISANGRFVAFDSYAGNLVAGDPGGKSDVFVRDLRTHKTQRISVSSAGARGNNDSFQPSISADGRYVAFYSHASNLVPPDTNGIPDIFVRDLKAHTTQRVTVSSTGKLASSGYGPRGSSISASGRFVAFGSDAPNLVPGDTNHSSDVFVRDLKTQTTKRVSLSSAGAQAPAGSVDPSISPDGRYVAFESLAKLVPSDTNGRPDIFVRDLKTHTTQLVSVSSAGARGDGESDEPSISASGRYVAFQSYANTLVAGDTNAKADIFVRDLKTHTTRRVSVSSAGAQADGPSRVLSISGDGRFVAFDSEADNLVPGDTNGRLSDVFVRGPLHP
jgi:Tol biopolymer transport system component